MTPRAVLASLPMPLILAPALPLPMPLKLAPILPLPMPLNLAPKLLLPMPLNLTPALPLPMPLQLAPAPPLPMHLPLPIEMDPVFTTFFRSARAAFIGSQYLQKCFLCTPPQFRVVSPIDFVTLQPPAKVFSIVHIEIYKMSY